MECRDLGPINNFLSSFRGKCITFAYEDDLSLTMSYGVNEDLLKKSLIAYVVCSEGNEYVLHITYEGKVLKCLGIDELVSRLVFRDRGALLTKNLDSTLPLKDLIKEVS